MSWKSGDLLLCVRDDGPAKEGEIWTFVRREGYRNDLFCARRGNVADVFRGANFRSVESVDRKEHESLVARVSALEAAVGTATDQPRQPLKKNKMVFNTPFGRIQLRGNRLPALRDADELHDILRPLCEYLAEKGNTWIEMLWEER